jgi:hypothetical protein
VSFVVITLCVASQRVFIVVSVYFIIDSVRKLLDTPSYFRILYVRMFLMCSVDLSMGAILARHTSRRYPVRGQTPASISLVTHSAAHKNVTELIHILHFSQDKQCL